MPHWWSTFVCAASLKQISLLQICNLMWREWMHCSAACCVSKMMPCLAFTVPVEVPWSAGLLYWETDCTGINHSEGLPLSIILIITSVVHTCSPLIQYLGCRIAENGPFSPESNKLVMYQKWQRKAGTNVEKVNRANRENALPID